MQLQGIPCRIADVCLAYRCAHSRFPRVGMSCVSAIQVTELFIALSEWLELILIFPMRKTVVLQFLLERNKNRSPAVSVACRCWGESGSLLLRLVALAVGSCKDAGSGWQNWSLNPHSCASPHIQKQSLYVLCTQGVVVFAVPKFQFWWGGKSPPVTRRD